jgi:steroid delta-isomerase-like uncharacterized protein
VPPNTYCVLVMVAAFTFVTVGALVTVMAMTPPRAMDCGNVVNYRDLNGSQSTDSRRSAMQAEENKALIRRWITMWNTGNLAAIDDAFASTYSVNGELVGPEGVRRAVSWLHATFANANLAIGEMVAEGDKVAVSWSMRGIQRGAFMDVPATNKHVTLDGINIYHIADGKIASNTERVDVLGLLRQLGAQVTTGQSN